MKILFVIYAGLIPIVPLIGLEIYRAKKNKKKATPTGSESFWILEDRDERMPGL